MENCLVILYSPEETGALELVVRIRKYKDSSEALMAYAETPCYWSTTCEEDKAQVIAALAKERFKEGLLFEDTEIG